MQTAALAIAAASMLLAGCGGDDEPQPSGSASASAKPTTLSVGHLPVVTIAPLFLGIEKGFFKEEGLEIKPQTVEAPATIPGVVSGDLDVAFTGPPPTLLARSNGLPIKAAAPAAVSATGKEPIVQVVVPEDSSIASLKDLAGKRLAVDGLFQLPHIATLRAGKAAGANTESWKVVEAPYPSMPQSLKSGKVDAILVGEPFLSNALDDGNKSIAGIYDGWEPGSPFSLYVTSERFLGENKDAVARFSRAMVKANKYANANEAEVRRIIPTYLELPAAVAKKIRLPVFSETADLSGLEQWRTVMKDEGVLKKDVKVADVLQASL